MMAALCAYQHLKDNKMDVEFMPVFTRQEIIFLSCAIIVMFRTGLLTNCTRCGYIVEAWTEGGIAVKVKCRLCGFQGVIFASSDINHVACGKILEKLTDDVLDRVDAIVER